MKKMIKKLVFTVIAAVLALVGAIVPVRAETEGMTKCSFILMEAETGAVLDEENADKRVNAGYLTKLMALLLIAEDIETGKYSLEKEMTASQSVTGTKGAVIWLEAGDKLSVDELLKGMIIGNANDAVTVLAEASEGDVENFTARMNSEAFDLGLRNTAFYSPYGYYDEREYTTARDMAVICSELEKFTFLETYFTTWRDFIKEGQTELVSENTLTRTFEGHIGFKASHSEQSGYCIAEGGRSADGAEYIAVVLGASDETESLNTAKSLIKRGFSDFRITAPGFLDELLMPLRVRNGVDSAVEVRLKSQSSVVVPKGTGEISNVIVMPDYINAPVEKGDAVGTAAFYCGETLLYETDIITSDSVEAMSAGYIFKKLLLNLIEK